MRWILVAIAALALAASGSEPAYAQFSDGKLVIGVMGDDSGVAADIGGPGSVVAARMAVADFGGSVGGVPIEILSADHQEKPDLAATIAREWFDKEGVDVIADLPNAGIVYNLATVATQKKRTLLISGAASDAVTGANCSPYVTHWTDDTYALAQGTVRTLLKQGVTSWYFITADYSFGHELQSDATAVIEANGGHVVGAALTPLGTADFAPLLLQAQSSRAQVIALATVGTDTVNAVKQAAQFGIVEGGQKLSALHAFETDVNSLGQEAAQGLIITTGFYWNESDGTRAFARRFFAIQHRMPTREQDGVYASVMHYLKAVKAANTDDAAAVNAAMRRLPVDRFGQQTQILPNGRVTYDLNIYRVKPASQSREPWDFYEKIGSVPADVAFRPVAQSGCKLSQQAQ